MIRTTFFATFFLAAAVACGKDAPELDREAAGEAYEIQGEYVGEVAAGDQKVTLAVQVIALGNDMFSGVGFHGGLPGAGWNGEDKNQIPAAKAVDGVLELKNDYGVGIVKDGKLTVMLGGQEKPAGVLTRVERKSPTLGKKPPEGAVVLFDGSSVDAWQGGKMTEEGLLVQGTKSKQTFGDHTLHIEFLLPFKPAARGQGRGNSGVYVQGKYEVQVLDSFGLEGKMNECGGIYSVKACDLNMCFPALQWQTYDIDYAAGKYDDQGKSTEPPVITVRHNGVVIHKGVELPGDRNTTAAPIKAGPEKGPIYLQNHGNPVRYRNIWVVEK